MKKHHANPRSRSRSQRVETSPAYNLDPVFAEIERVLPSTTDELARLGLVQGKQFLEDWQRRYPPELPLSNVPQEEWAIFARIAVTLWCCGVKIEGVQDPPDLSTIYPVGVTFWDQPSNPTAN